MIEETAPVLRDDITPVIEFVSARLNERFPAVPGNPTAGELEAAAPEVTWMMSLVHRYRSIVDYADAPYRAAEMTPETTARQAGYIHALAVAIETMADIWKDHPDMPVYEYKTGVWAVPGERGRAT